MTVPNPALASVRSAAALRWSVVIFACVVASATASCDRSSEPSSHDGSAEARATGSAARGRAAATTRATDDGDRVDIDIDELLAARRASSSGQRSPSASRDAHADATAVSNARGRVNGAARLVDGAGSHEPPGYDGPFVVVFWGIWCDTCHDELDRLAAWQRENPDAATILAVHHDGEEFHERAAREATEQAWPFDVVLPSRAQLARWNPRSLTPTTLFVSTDGTVTERIVGFGEAEQTLLERALARVAARSTTAR